METNYGNKHQNGPGEIGAIQFSRVVELSHPISSQMPVWPGDPAPLFEQWAHIPNDGYFLRRFSLSEHAGTHLTAPASFYPDGRSVDEYRPEDLVKPVAVIDVRDRRQGDPDYSLTVDDLAEWEATNGPFPEGSIALLLTGWSSKWGEPSGYLGIDENGTLHFPGFGVDASSFLIEERGAAGLGTDTAGLEPGIDDSFAVSRLLLAQPRIALENLANLEQLPPMGATVVIGVLRLIGGSGSPAAVTALLPATNK